MEKVILKNIYFFIFFAAMLLALFSILSSVVGSSAAMLTPISYRPVCFFSAANAALRLSFQSIRNIVDVGETSV